MVLTQKEKRAPVGTKKKKRLHRGKKGGEEDARMFSGERTGPTEKKKKSEPEPLGKGWEKR